MTTGKTTRNDRADASPAAQRAGAKPAAASTAPATAKPAVAFTIPAGRGPVDAPGKRHRKPPPQESINKRMGEPTGKKMGQKSFKLDMRRGRG